MSCALPASTCAQIFKVNTEFPALDPASLPRLSILCCLLRPQRAAHALLASTSQHKFGVRAAGLRDAVKEQRGACHGIFRLAHGARPCAAVFDSTLCMLTQALPGWLPQLGLTSLDISFCRVADIRVITHCTSLQVLSLQVLAPHAHAIPTASGQSLALQVIPSTGVC